MAVASSCASGTEPDDEPNQPPSVSIFSPANSQVFSQGQTVTFEGSASDPEDGTLSGTALVWSSSTDGQLGTGGSFSESDLSLGIHTIALTATDTGGKKGTASVSITVNPDSTPGAFSGRVFRSQDNAPFSGVRVVRSGLDGDAEVITDATGRYDFFGVPVGDHEVSVVREDLPLFGSFDVAGVRQITLGPGQSLDDLDFGFRLAEVEVRTVASARTAAGGAEIEISLELDVSDIPLPLSGINGTIAWPTSGANLVPGSPTGGEAWGRTGGTFLSNESTPGTLRFVAISPLGIEDNLISVMSFRVTTVAGNSDFTPVLDELEVIDPDTGESVKLLVVVLLRVIAASVTVQ